jgi:uncharacterized protein involved in type VI secretion and phage assembly
MAGSLEDLILGVIERWWASRYSERHGIVTSYDPQKYLAKVTFQPEGQESGWLPIETGHIGDGYGIAVGLQPGDGTKTGDQVIVRFQEGDFEAGKIVQRVHSDEDTPPTVQSGELVIWTRFRNSGGDDDSAQGGQGGTGQKIYFKNDGSIAITDGNGATFTLDGQGNILTACKKFIVNGTDIGLKGSGNVVVKAGNKLGIEATVEAVWQDGTGDVSSTAVTPPGSAASTPPFQTP